MSRPARNYLEAVDHPVKIVGANGMSFEVDFDPERPDYVTDEGIAVWIERTHRKTRFLDADGNQVGPVHQNLVPAIVYALADGWIDPTCPAWWNDACIAEVRAGGAPPTKFKEDAAAWNPLQHHSPITETRDGASDQGETTP